MAIYHFTAKIISRQQGRSVIAAAAYRAGIRLEEHRTNTTHDYTHKSGVEHTEILAPDHAPTWVFDRSHLWNNVDQSEKRKDAQLARDLEIALPVELNNTAQVQLLHDFVRRDFVSKGMIADCAIHRDNPNNPHAHVLLTLRHIGPDRFGLKERSWNQRSMLLAWRMGWSEVANEHLAKAGLAVRIDHRTLEAQGLDLIPGRKIGVSLERQQPNHLPRRIADRVTEQRQIASENGSLIIADPIIAIKAMAHYQPTFTHHDIAKFLHTRTDGAAQFDAAFFKVITSPELVPLGENDPGHRRYSSRERLEIEEQKLIEAELLNLRSAQRAIAECDAADLTKAHRQSRPRSVMGEIDALQQRAAEQWRDQYLAREHEQSTQPHLHHENDTPSDPSISPQHETQQHPPLEHPGLEDDFEI